jgi:isopenicillin-N epimerase
VNDLRELWGLEPGLAFLNHGSFGACPRAVLEHQSALRERMERQPVRLLGRDLPELLDAARAEVAAFVGADADDLVFVPNATTGVNTALRSLRLQPGDELLVTDHAYNACRNALDAVAEAAGANVVVATVPFPSAGDNEVVGAVLSAVTGRTRLALLDHVTSPTALVFPIWWLVTELLARGVETLVDGAHAPGMLPLQLSALGAGYYTGNGHKWLCAPKGSGFLHVRRDLQERVRPLVISHGANRPREGQGRFQAEFDWTGTSDPTPFLCMPEAIRFMGSLLPGGWPALMRSNHEKALAAGALLRDALGIEPSSPESMIGSMVTLRLPDSRAATWASEPLQADLLKRFGIEVPVIGWPGHPRRAVRISAQVYNTAEEYGRLAAALGELLRVE